MLGLVQKNKIISGSVVVVGAGPVAYQFVQLLQEKHPEISIEIYGAESYRPYDRVNLGRLLLDGDLSAEDLLLENHDESVEVAWYTGKKIQSIDAKRRIFFTEDGEEKSYSLLVLATGAMPKLPAISGMELPGVFTYRTLDDALLIRKQAAKAKQIVILGAGLLGLETAAILHQRQGDREIHILERGTGLRYPVLGEEQYQQIFAQSGMHFHTEAKISNILGEEHVTSITLTNGTVLQCDLLIIAIGVQPNTLLAEQAGLEVSNGIIVNDDLQTSDPHIFAIGDCAEHRGVTYGLIAPGYQQAAVLAERLAGNPQKYHGSNPCPRLKLNYIGPESEEQLTEWSVGQVVCECNQIACEKIVRAIRQGHDSLEALTRETGAGSNCGSCRPYLVELLGKTSKPEPPRSWWFLQVMALLTVFIGLTYLLFPGFGYQDSVTVSLQWDTLWRNSLTRQITGFSLLIIAILVSLLSIRKRVRSFRWGNYVDWRNAHLILGLLITVTLLIHTGARFGDNLDAALMGCFILVLITGGVLTSSIANEHKFSPVSARRFRMSSLWLHLLALWPLPSLLVFHVLKSYYF